jgi:3-oxoacyl-[acyl-carrier-protein] synthase II
MTSSSSRRVVVTGLGALTPIGNTVKESWKALCEGRSGGGPITRFDTDVFSVKIACELKHLRLEDHFDRKFINRNDKLTLYGLLAAREAWKASRLNEQAINTKRAGVIWASGNGGAESMEEGILDWTNTHRFSPYFIPRILIDTPSGAIALEYGLQGINYCPVSACASSTSAIMDAFNYIRWNKADIMITGGSEAPITRANIGGFASMKALSRNNDHPQQASKPLDEHRDGFVMGEGAGALILEEYEHARKRGATIYAEVVGAGMSNDAYHATATHPEGEGAVLAMTMALEEAGISADKLSYINLHATGTPVGDLSELAALSNLVSDHKRSSISISATKGATGHLLGAAGAVEAVFTVMSLLTQTIPPTINSTHPDPDLPKGFNYVWNQSRKSDALTYAMSNSFGFGGHNATAVFRNFSE